MPTFNPVIDFDRLLPETVHRVQIGRRAIALIRLGEEVYALEDRCSHEEVPLSEGFVEGEVITCAMHGAQFNVKTGEVLSLPAYEGVKTYPARVRDGKVEVELD